MSLKSIPRISSNDLRVQLGTVLERAIDDGEPTIVTRYNLPVAVVVPYEAWLADQEARAARPVDPPPYDAP